MFDWDKIVIEVDNNIVDLTAGEVALLIAADADTVSWGNITGDLTQQADLMLELDSKIDVDSPEFTGVPRTPTPPAGNSSTRIANTKFVNDAINAVIPEGGFGLLASKDTVNYETEVTNKPALGSLASKDKVNYNTDITNKPTFGALASKNTVDYQTEVTNKPTLSDLEGVVEVESGGTGCSSEQELKNYILSLTEQKNPQVRYWVDGDQGNDRTGDGSSENPFKTIQKAIDTASPFVETTINVLQGAFGEILTIEEKNIQITMVERQTPYYPGLWLVHNKSAQSLQAAINVKNGSLRFYGNLRIDTVGDGIDIENGYVFLDGNPNTDAVRINCTRTDNSGKRSVAVRERSVFVCTLKLYAHFNEVSGVQSNNIGISCHEWSYASVDSIDATYIDRLFYLYDTSLAYCGEASGSYLRYSVTEKSALPNIDTLGSLAYKNTVDYETEVYNKPTSSGEVEQNDIAAIQNNSTDYIRVNAGDFVWFNNSLFIAKFPYFGKWEDAPDGTFAVKKIANEVSAKFNKEATARVLTTDNGSVTSGEYFIFGNTLYRADELNNQGQTPTQVSSVVKLADEVEELYKGYAPYFSVYGNYGAGSYVKYLNTLYKYIYKHNTGDWDTDYVVSTNYSKELSTSELLIEAEPTIPIGAPEYEGVDKEIRKAGAHAITKIHMNNATPGSTTVSETVKTVVISGHKRITVRAINGNKITFNGLYGSQYHLDNKFYSIIVEDGAILELEGNISVTHSDSNGILVRRGGMVIYRSINGSVLNISLPSENYHDGILVESGGKFIAEGNIVATRGSTIYQQYPSHVINVSYGAEAHVKGITATNFNYCIGCTGGLASYDSVSGAGIFTASGGRIYTGTQSQ